MKLERSNIEFPLWRKKVDSSLFEHNGSTIPAWACTMWGIQKLFAHCNSKNMEDSKVSIVFQQTEYPGNVTVAKEGLWSMPNPIPPWEYRRLHRRQGEAGCPGIS